MKNLRTCAFYLQKNSTQLFSKQIKPKLFFRTSLRLMNYEHDFGYNNKYTKTDHKINLLFPEENGMVLKCMKSIEM